MAAFANLRREEQLGLGVAVAAHVALAAALMMQVDRSPPLAPVERMTVSLADEISLTDTAPDPSAQPAAAMAPTLADTPAPAPVPPVEQAVERPRETVTQPRPQPRATAAPRPSPAPSPRATQAREQPRAQPAPTRTAGASRIGADFLEGNSNADGNRGSPAAEFGAREAASLASAIQRQLRPHWTAPNGVDAELLVTQVRFRLNRDGSLAGNPTCVSTTGVNASNAPQKDLHCERATRAVRLAAPFNLPEQFYDKWKLVTSQFDRRL